MGKRGNRNRNSGLKKKTVQNPENSKQEILTSSQNLPKKDLKKSDASELVQSLRLFKSSLFEEFRSRLSGTCLSYSDSYSIVDQLKPQPHLQIFSNFLNDLAQDLLSILDEFPYSLTEFLQESHKCMQTACLVLEKVSSPSLLNISKISFYSNIFKPLWEANKSLHRNNELKMLHKDLHSLSKEFKDHNLLPVENLVQMINGTFPTKTCFRMHADSSTDESNSPSRNFDFEVEEFRNRLESCEILATRKKPQVSQDWINTLKRQISNRS